MNSEEEEIVKRKLIDGVSEIVRGTEFAPPEGGVLVDVLAVMIHVDNEGEYGSSWLSFGSAEAAEGMARKVIRGVEGHDIARLYFGLKEEDE